LEEKNAKIFHVEDCSRHHKNREIFSLCSDSYKKHKLKDKKD